MRHCNLELYRRGNRASCVFILMSVNSLDYSLVAAVFAGLNKLKHFTIGIYIIHILPGTVTVLD